MPGDLDATIKDAAAAGNLLEPAANNIRHLLGNDAPPRYRQAVAELAGAGAWNELNDRFYKTLAFGTGGLRGRTIGKMVTPAERGKARENQTPEFPCVGTNAMNFYNINRATRGLIAYLREWQDRQKLSGKPKLVIAHDTRFFSKEFAEVSARIAADNGCDAFVFDGPRSTPELSFAVRHLRAGAGVVITASHNPPHDNGYKVYFGDGAQVVEPHASGIIEKVNAITSETFDPLPKDRQGTVTTLGQDVDLAYMRRLESLIVDASVIAQAKSLRIVFTPLHGTGGVIVKPMLKQLGFNFEVVAEQDRFDGAFPTVKSPNPENAEALQMGIALAEKSAADLVIATDPDCDRMGVAVRAASGKMKLLSGNQIGSLIAYYRTKKFFDLKILNQKNASRAVIIKTFVTTDLQKAIAEHFGVRCVETLTGFKYIGAKLGKYERVLLEALRNRPHLNPLPEGEEDPATAGPGEGREQMDYVDLDEEESCRLRLEHSAFYIFGGEESYGYSGGDFVRDKDGNGAVIMFCEMAAYAKSRKQTVDQLLDEIFSTFGYFEEKNGSLVFEGAEGASKIARLVDSYARQPPTGMLGSCVVRIRNFAAETMIDVEGDEIPKEKMSIFELEDHTRIAVRASGTEPKIKYYMFAQRRPDGGKFDSAALDRVKQETGDRLEQLWQWLQTDAHARLGG